MQLKRYQDAVVIGFALFAMFFGAGNLIFPPVIGRDAGEGMIVALIGFLTTGVGLPLLGMIACAKENSSFDMIARRVGYGFGNSLMVLMLLTLGPLVAIPRTAATTYELGVSTLIPTASLELTTCLYFIIVLLLVLRPSAVVDRIGKILTPILLLVLMTIIVKGVVFPIGEVVATPMTDVFSTTLMEGYQTMDAMASVIFASIIITTIRAKGYQEKRDITRVMLQAGGIATAGLTLVYGGLMVLGSQTSGLDVASFSRTELVLFISQTILGDIGTLLLSVTVSLACITTSVALLSSSATFFTELCREKISYSVIVVILTLISGLVALNDVDQIVAQASPILSLIYPTVIVLILITLLGSRVKNDTVIKYTVYTTVVMSLFDLLITFEIEGLSFLHSLMEKFLFYEQGFAWVLPAFIVFTVTSLATEKQKRYFYKRLPS